MKKYLFIFAAAFLLLIVTPFTVAHAAGGTAYYIAQNGSNSNSGTSVSSPWPINKLSSITFMPGDSILFNKGDTFANVAINLSSSGSSGVPITFGAYGIGNNPILDGGGSGTPVITISNAGYVTINDIVIQNSTANNGSIYVYRCHDVTIKNVYITDVSTGVYAQGCANNIVFTDNYVLNVQGPLPRGQMIQFNNVSGAGNVIARNKLQDVAGQSNPEDGINLYMSNGSANSPIEVTDNWIRGGGPSTTGGGIVLGDNGGSYQEATNNILVNPGQYGIGIAGGTHMKISNNKIYAAENVFTNIGIDVYNQSPTSCSSATVADNEINWTNSAGVANPIWSDNSCGTVSGWNSNFLDSAISSSLLPNPLWSGAPWNTFIAPPIVTPPSITPVIVPTAPTVSTVPSAPSGGGGNSAPVVYYPDPISISSIPNGCLSSTAFSPLTGQQCPNFTGSIPVENSTTPLFTATIAVGTNSGSVTILQHYLNTHGFPVSVTGPGSLNNETTYFGPATKAAVQKFQIANAIPASGMADTTTITTINQKQPVQSQTNAKTISIVVLAKTLNVRAAPDGTIIGTVLRGIQGFETSVSGNWYRVSFSNGLDGWVWSNYVQEY